MKYAVGQSLWYVPADRPWEKPRAVSIVKIGRKWLELNEPWLAVDRVTLTAKPRKGYEPRGQCYLSKADYERYLRRHSAWRHLRRQVQDKWTAPETVTLEQIQAAADLLRLTAYV